MGILGVVFLQRQGTPTEGLECKLVRESIRDVVIRAGKVYLFIMALVFLGEGFKPLILEYIIQIPSEGLYWVNIVSAVLDNATLAAAEIGPQLSHDPDKKRINGAFDRRGYADPRKHPQYHRSGQNGNHQ